MSKESTQSTKTYNLRLKLRLDGRYALVLSNDKPAFVLTKDKRGEFHIISKSKEWEYRMLHEGGIQDYLSELLNCLHGYKFEVEKLEWEQNLLVIAFSNKKSSTI